MKIMGGLLLISLCAASGFGQAAMKPKNADIENIGNRYINRGTLNFVSIQKEIATGRQLAATYEAQVTLATDPSVQEYVDRLGQDLVRNSDAKVPFTFKVVDSSELAAR